MIRDARLEDEEAIYNLICEMENEWLERTAFQDIYSEQLQDDSHTFLLYMEENQVAGVLHLRIERQLHHVSAVAEIMELAVREESRSGGIGGKLFREACKRAAKADCLQIEVASNRIRKRAHGFYENQGMKKSHYKFTMKLKQKIEQIS